MPRYQNIHLYLDRGDLFGAKVREYIDQFVHVVTETYSANAVWIDPGSRLIAQPDNELFLKNLCSGERCFRQNKVRHVLTNSTDTRHVKSACQEMGISLISLQGLNLNDIWGTARWTVALLLRCTRPRNRYGLPGRDLVRRRLFIVAGPGGRVARQLNRILTAQNPLFPANKVNVVTPDVFPQVAAQAEIVLLCLPANPKYDHLVDRDWLAQLPRGAVLVNTARDTLVNESDIVLALNNGQLSQYATDFQPRGPVPDNFVWSGHVAGYSAEDLERTQMLTLKRFVSLLKDQARQAETSS